MQYTDIMIELGMQELKFTIGWKKSEDEYTIEDFWYEGIHAVPDWLFKILLQDQMDRGYEDLRDE